MKRLADELEHIAKIIHSVEGGLSLAIIRLMKIQEELRKKEESEETSYRT